MGRDILFLCNRQGARMGTNTMLSWRPPVIAAARVNSTVWSGYACPSWLTVDTHRACNRDPARGWGGAIGIKPSCELSGQPILRKLAARWLWGWAKDIYILYCLPGAKNQVLGWMDGSEVLHGAKRSCLPGKCNMYQTRARLFPRRSVCGRADLLSAVSVVQSLAVGFMNMTNPGFTLSFSNCSNSGAAHMFILSKQNTFLWKGKNASPFQVLWFVLQSNFTCLMNISTFFSPAIYDL